MVTALILAGGTGTRLGADMPKQYIEVNGMPIIAYCLERFISHPKINRIQIVADRSWHELIQKYASAKFMGFSDAGANRQLSIYNGLCDIQEYSADDDIVVIHDAARPNVSDKTISECISAAMKHDGAIPVLPMKDTVYLSENANTISQLIPRSRLFAGQAPEAFRLGAYLEANRRLLPDDILSINGSTEPAILHGMDIAMIDGDERNFKITTPADLERFKEMVIK